MLQHSVFVFGTYFYLLLKNFVSDSVSILTSLCYVNGKSVNRLSENSYLQVQVTVADFSIRKLKNKEHITQ